MAGLSSSFQRLTEIRAHQPVNPEDPGPVLLGTSRGEDEKDRNRPANGASSSHHAISSMAMGTLS